MKNISTKNTQTKNINKIVKLTALAAILMHVLSTQIYAQSYDLGSIRDAITGEVGKAPHIKDIPSGSDGYLYKLMGFGQQILDEPAVSDIIGKSRMSARAGLGYSCGKFDPTANVEQMINQITSKIKKMPGQFVAGATAAIASYSSYLLNKVNPTLYNTITKTLDDGFDFFDFQFKSCQEYESDLKNDGSDYYQMAKKSASENLGITIKEKPKAGIEDNVQDTIEDGGDKGIKLAGGKAKGGSGQAPIDFISEAVIAGYNLSLARTDTTSTAAASASEIKGSQLANVFNTPDKAKSTLIRMYGSVEVQINNGNEAPVKTTPGNGILLDFNQDSLYFLNAMQAIVKDNSTIKQVVDNSGADIPQAMKDIIKTNAIPQDIQDMRTLSAQARHYQLLLRADEMAVLSMTLKLNMLKDILRVGIKEANLQQSSSKAEMEITVLMVIDEIERDLYKLKNRGN